MSTLSPDIQLKKSSRNIAATTPVIVADLGGWAGHRANYLKIITRLFSEQNVEVFVVTINEEEMQTFLTDEALQNVSILKNKINNKGKIFLKLTEQLNVFVKLLKSDKWFQPESTRQLLQIKYLQEKHQLKNALVFFTSVSDVMPLIPMALRTWLFPSQWAGIFVTTWYNTGNVFSKTARIHRAYGNRSMALDSCKGIFVIHDLYTTYYRRLLHKDHFVAIPEPISLTVNRDFELAKTIKQKSNGRYIITLLGGIGKKRNFLLLLDALKQLNHSSFFLVLVGKLQKADFSTKEQNHIDDFYHEYQDQCFWKLDGYVTVEPDFNALIDISDCMYLHYHNHPFSSNQLLKAIALRKPVVVNEGGIVEAIVTKANWSKIATADSLSIKIALEALMEKFEIDEVAYQQFLNDLDYKNLSSRIWNQLKPELSIPK